MFGEGFMRDFLHMPRTQPRAPRVAQPARGLLTVVLLSGQKIAFSYTERAEAEAARDRVGREINGQSTSLLVTPVGSAQVRLTEIAAVYVAGGA